MYTYRCLTSAIITFVVALLSCTSHPSAQTGKANPESSSARPNSFPEHFEGVHKTNYAPAMVALPSGSWYFDGALIGTSERDAKMNGAAVRLRGEGSITMQFDIVGKVRQVSILAGTYSGDKNGRCSLQYSTDAGAHWSSAGAEVTTTPALRPAAFTLDVAGPVRFRVTAHGNQRINIDDFSIITDGNNEARAIIGPTTVTPTRDDNMALGNPSGAKADGAAVDNYLLIHPQYALSYNSSKGMANWVSWHLSSAWRGSAERCNCFMSDGALPERCYKALSSAYIATGFDRGHLCPSDDRTATAEDNAATFLMSNISPQAPFLNQQTWQGLEAYCRDLINQGQEAYIIAGGYGFGGSGSKGGMTAAIGGGRINVPAHFWKVVVVLPVGSDDVHRISATTRIITVDMPNIQSVNAHSWDYYRVSVRSLEAATGYHFLSNVPVQIQQAIKSRVDAVPVE